MAVERYTVLGACVLELCHFGVEFYCDDTLLGALAAEFLKVITKVFGHSFVPLLTGFMHPRLSRISAINCTMC